MTLEEIRRAIKAQPFKPFTIHLADQRSFEVPHPEFVLLPPTGRVFVVYDRKGRKGGFEHIDLLLVTSIAMGPVSTA